jgi:hypothetical protein
MKQQCHHVLGHDQTFMSPMGFVAGYLIAILSAVYAAVLTVGLLTLPTPEHPIQNPWFTIMELLILMLAPGMVVFSTALHAWVTPARKPFALLGIVFMGMCAVVTCSVHFAVLTLSRQPAFVVTDWTLLVFSFTWPSVVYALDILAWDVFFPFSAFSIALALQGIAQAKAIQMLFIVSAVLAFAGLAGIPLENMNIRNIGIIGYVVLFPCGTALLAHRIKRGHV